MDREDSQKEYVRITTALPPGPWHSRGNTVLAGDQTVCVVFARQASLVAHFLARYPAHLEALFDGEDGAAARIAQLEERLEVAESERDDLKIELEAARDEAASLRADLDNAQKELDDRLAGR